MAVDGTRDDVPASDRAVDDWDGLSRGDDPTDEPTDEPPFPADDHGHGTSDRTR
jgi:hypothetical protein